VLNAEVTPRLATDTWTFAVEGLVEQPTTWSWDEIHALEPSTYRGAIHCVTTWSKFDMEFGGVSVDTLLDITRPLPAATQGVGRVGRRRRAAAPGSWRARPAGAARDLLLDLGVPVSQIRVERFGPTG
jgi:DMSO/TMAO reductase YedYZ molybdopterin-dependent catalytic subunit